MDVGASDQDPARSPTMISDWPSGVEGSMPGSNDPFRAAQERARQQQRVQQQAQKQQQAHDQQLVEEPLAERGPSAPDSVTSRPPSATHFDKADVEQHVGRLDNPGQLKRPQFAMSGPVGPDVTNPATGQVTGTHAREPYHAGSDH
jgi:hypothetical protein